MLTAIDSLRPRLSALAAQRKRKEADDDHYYAPIERRQVPFAQRLRDIVGKPFEVLFSEPMLIAITIYMSVCLVSTIGALSFVDCLPSVVHFWVRSWFYSWITVFILNRGLKVPLLAL